MSEAMVRWRTCDRKVSYETEGKANKVARKMKHPNTRVYECPYCHCWHITKAQKQSPDHRTIEALE